MAVRLQKNSYCEALADAFDPRENAFGFCRFVLAAVVIFDHSYVLGGFGVDPLRLSASAIVLFFVLSGFLITRSASRTSTGRFVWHRFLRLFPGYWVCLIVSAFILAPIIYQIEYTHAYRIFGSLPDSPQSYVWGNFAMLHLNGWSIPGMTYVWPRSVGATLHENPYPYNFNGSIWTLPYELVCYLGVGALALLGVLKRARRALLLGFVLEWGLYTFRWLEPLRFEELFPVDLSGLLMFSLYFLAGALCFLYREEIPFSSALLLLSTLLLAGGLVGGWFDVIAPLALPYLFLWLACKLPMQRFDAHGDYSYGLYIYAFPIQQTLVFFRLQAAGFWTYFLCSLLLSTLFGILSYRLIEAPCLCLKNIDPRALIANLRRAKRQPASLPVIAVESTSL